MCDRDDNWYNTDISLSSKWWEKFLSSLKWFGRFINSFHSGEQRFLAALKHFGSPPEHDSQITEEYGLWSNLGVLLLTGGQWELSSRWGDKRTGKEVAFNVNTLTRLYLKKHTKICVHKWSLQSYLRTPESCRVINSTLLTITFLGIYSRSGCRGTCTKDKASL